MNALHDCNGGHEFILAHAFYIGEFQSRAELGDELSDGIIEFPINDDIKPLFYHRFEVQIEMFCGALRSKGNVGIAAYYQSAYCSVGIFFILIAFDLSRREGAGT